jgi:hypothetical protein
MYSFIIAAIEREVHAESISPDRTIPPQQTNFIRINLSLSSSTGNFKLPTRDGKLHGRPGKLTERSIRLSNAADAAEAAEQEATYDGHEFSAHGE